VRQRLPAYAEPHTPGERERQVDAPDAGSGTSEHGDLLHAIMKFAVCSLGSWIGIELAPQRFADGTPGEQEDREATTP
jgi:hypothetical protein